MRFEVLTLQKLTLMFCSIPALFNFSVNSLKVVSKWRASPIYLTLSMQI